MTLYIIKPNSSQSVTGFAIACFSDPGVTRLRQETSRPVLGIREAAVSDALTRGEQFDIIAIRPASIARHLAAVSSMGLNKRSAGDRALDLSVKDLADEKRALDRLISTACQLRDEDGADVLILGCAGMAQYRSRVEAATRHTGDRPDTVRRCFDTRPYFTSTISQTRGLTC